jgi:hypothetical protein
MKSKILAIGASKRTGEHAGPASKKPIICGISVGAGT